MTGALRESVTRDMPKTREGDEPQSSPSRVCWFALARRLLLQRPCRLEDDTPVRRAVVDAQRDSDFELERVQPAVGDARGDRDGRPAVFVAGHVVELEDADDLFPLVR